MGDADELPPIPEKKETIRGPLTEREFAVLCDKMAENGGDLSAAAREMRLNRQAVYSFLRKHPNRRDEMNFSRKWAADDDRTTARRMAVIGIPVIRTGERGAIEFDQETGEPIYDMVPQPNLMAALLKDNRDMVNRIEDREHDREMVELTEAVEENLEADIANDSEPETADIGKKD